MWKSGGKLGASQPSETIRSLHGPTSLCSSPSSHFGQPQMALLPSPTSELLHPVPHLLGFCTAAGSFTLLDITEHFPATAGPP